MNEESERALKKQKMHLVIVVLLVGVAALGIGGHIFSNSTSPNDNLFEPKIDLPVDEFKAKEVWMDRLESQVGLLTQKQKYYEETLLEYKEKERANENEKIELKKHLAHLKKEMEKSNEFSTNKENASQLEASTVALNHVDDDLRAHFSEQRATPINKSKTDMLSNNPFSEAPLNGNSTYSNFSDYQENPMEPPLLKPPLCAYTMSEDKEGLTAVNKRPPANLSVKAILISSLDAVCRLDAQSDPIPVKLRLIDDGHLPEGVTVKLKGCLLGASAYGDISNERVYMRLENLTMVNAKGEAIETEVTGYVSGEDGRFGMRGTVVDRTTKILTNAVGSGILSGIGQTLQAACTRPSKETLNTYSIGSEFAQNTSSGASDAFTMLASYYIRRAEQVQPVLQVNAGRIVDVTFTHGFSMGDMHARDNIKKIRDRSRTKP